ncbi:hypothetical protein D3C81_1272070 [compost metagenome]
MTDVNRQALELARHELLAVEADHQRLADAVNRAERELAAHELPLAAARRKVRQARSKLDLVGAATAAEIENLKAQLRALEDGHAV